MQLIQPYVQKSRRTMRPRTLSSRSGAPPVLIQSSPDGKSGAWTIPEATESGMRGTGRGVNVRGMTMLLKQGDEAGLLEVPVARGCVP